MLAKYFFFGIFFDFEANFKKKKGQIFLLASQIIFF